MAENSKIQWTDNTWNVAVGCEKISAGCKYCYMMRDYEGRFGRKDVNGTVTRTKSATFNKPLVWQKKGLKSADGRPLKVFTSSLTDVFHPQIDSYRDEIWDIIRRCPDLIFQILTKRPERMLMHLPRDWGYGYPNVWLGVSVENTDNLWRVEALSKIPAAVRFVSAEPLIGKLVFTADDLFNFSLMDWVIIGGESGNENGKYKYRPCHLDWIEDIIDVARKFEVAVFVKQLGTFLSKYHALNDRHGGDINEWGDTYKIREFPASYSTDEQHEQEIGPFHWTNHKYLSP